MKWFKALWIFNALMSLFPVIYFFVGMADGSVTSSNMGMWMAILLLVGAVLYGPVWLKNNGRIRLAKVVLIIAGAPYAMMILIYLLTIFLGPTGWQ